MLNDFNLIQALASRSFGDCDTFTIHVPDWPAIVGDKMPVRIWGIDTPEIHDLREHIKELAFKAKDRLEQILKSGKIVLKEIRREKYFRIIAKVEVNGQDVSSILIAEGLARAYNGEGPQPWLIAE